MTETFTSYSDLLVTLMTKNAEAEVLSNQGWKFKVSRGRRGFCYYEKKIITIPKHALTSNKGVGYDEYYLAHEMAHAKAGKVAVHGPIFMEWLKKLCPPEFLHYELGYKPRNAKSAGIQEKQ